MTSIWEESFRKGVAAFRVSNFEEALQCFDEAIQLDGTRYKAYDSRAAIYEKLGRPKDALRDSRKVIELAPELQHGYARSARLFFDIGKYSAARDMIHYALERVSEDVPARYRELKVLQHTIASAISQSEEMKLAKKSPAKFPFFKLPVELVYQVFDHVIPSDKLFPATACLVSSHWRVFTLSRPEYWCYLVLSRRHPVRKMTRWLERSRNKITELRITSIETVGNLSPLISQMALSNVSSLIVEYLTVDWKVVAPQLHLLHTLVIKASSLPQPSVLTALLGANTGLEKLVLGTEKSWERLSAAIPISNSILLPKLVHLELLGPIDVAGLMSDLRVPALVHLYLYGTLSRADYIMEAIHPTPTALTELSIRNCIFTTARIVRILQQLTKLEKVEITLHGGDMNLVVDAFSQIRYEEGEERLTCPLLRCVNFSHSPNLGGGPIVRFVKSRMADIASNMGGGHPGYCFAMLEEICIDHCPRVDPSVAEWLRERVERVSCVYMTRKEMQGGRFM
ncbi:hypothetical protein BU17DRAFT_48792 [Hysterangium stoloniferum]|nr:hypothetical protein BU17DRAFT_48792 [Hysterangium stoloniferum]